MVELTEEEKQEARRKAVAQYQQNGTPKATEPQQADSEKRNAESNPHYLIFDMKPRTRIQKKIMRLSDELPN